jgi:hypothetical protein
MSRARRVVPPRVACTAAFLLLHTAAVCSAAATLPGTATWREASAICAGLGGLLDPLQLASRVAAGGFRLGSSDSPRITHDSTTFWTATSSGRSDAAMAEEALPVCEEGSPEGSGCPALVVRHDARCTASLPCERRHRFLCALKNGGALAVLQAARLHQSHLQRRRTTCSACSLSQVTHHRWSR